MIHPDTVVKPTCKGMGIFALRDFRRGEILWIIDDHDIRIPLAEYQAMEPARRHKFNTYSYLDVQQRVIVPWDEGKYVNHSCEPNSTALVQFDNISVALRDIRAGEEIVEDYSCYYGHFETFTCQCGSPRCRGVVSGDAPYEADLRLDLADVADVMAGLGQVLLQEETRENSRLIRWLAEYREAAAPRRAVSGAA